MSDKNHFLKEFLMSKQQLKLYCAIISIMVFLVGSLWAEAMGPLAGTNVLSGKRATFSIVPYYMHSRGGDETDLTDGKFWEPSGGKMDFFWTYKGTVGWDFGSFAGAMITFDLGQAQPIKALAFDTVAGKSDVTFPAAVFVYVSDDGKGWHYVTNLINEDIPQGSFIRHRFVVTDLRTRGRHLAFYVVNGAYYAFVDEIEAIKGNHDISKVVFTSDRIDSDKLENDALDRAKGDVARIKRLNIAELAEKKKTTKKRKFDNLERYVAIDNVVATGQTQPVEHSGDAADDPAIWLHPTDPNLSLIIGTDKIGGLGVYDLNGNRLQNLPDGRLNNVDVLYNFSTEVETFDIVAAGNRTEPKRICIYKVDPQTRRLYDITARQISIEMSEAYGFCLYRSPLTSIPYAFISDYEGLIQQWQLFCNDSGKIDARLVRTIKLDSVAEGMVADSTYSAVYFGEEDRGIWKYPAEPHDNTLPLLIAQTNRYDPNSALGPNVEGLTIYHTRSGKGYLIASGQRSGTFCVYERTGCNKYLFSFRIAENKSLAIDAVSGTDGIDVISSSMGTLFPYGLFVAQDNMKPQANQNFKLVPWQNIVTVTQPCLEIDPQWNPRSAPEKPSPAQQTIKTDEIQPLKVQTANSTQDKPQSKTWNNAGKWFTIQSINDAFSIFRLDENKWTPYCDQTIVFPPYAKTDCLTDGNDLYLLFVIPEKMMLVRLSYNKQRYFIKDTLEITPPSEVETASIALDSSGSLWIAADTKQKILVYSLDSSLDKQTLKGPFDLASGINDDDICAIISFDTDKIGVFWSDQNHSLFGFRYHNDGQPFEKWSASEIVDDTNNCADDHINLKADKHGNIFAAVKTSFDTLGRTQIALYARDTSGRWTSMIPVTKFTKDFDPTRPILQVHNNNLYVFYANFYTNSSNGFIEVAQAKILNNQRLTISPFSKPEKVLAPSISLSNVSGPKTIPPHQNNVCIIASGRVKPVVYTKLLALSP